MSSLTPSAVARAFSCIETTPFSQSRSLSTCLYLRPPRLPLFPPPPLLPPRARPRDPPFPPPPLPLLPAAPMPKDDQRSLRTANMLCTHRDHRRIRTAASLSCSLPLLQPLWPALLRSAQSIVLPPNESKRIKMSDVKKIRYGSTHFFPLVRRNVRRGHRRSLGMICANLEAATMDTIEHETQSREEHSRQ